MKRRVKIMWNLEISSFKFIFSHFPSSSKTKQYNKFHLKCFWLVVPCGKLVSKNQKHYPDLSSQDGGKAFWFSGSWGTTCLHFNGGPYSVLKSFFNSQLPPLDSYVEAYCSGGSRGGAPPSPLIFWRNWGPKGRKKHFLRPGPLPLISGSGWPPPLPLSEGL